MTVKYVIDTGPIKGGYAVTPDDDNDLTRVARGVYVGTSGDLKVTTLDGSIMTYPGLASGIVHPITAVRIHSTGTTATDILAQW